MSYQVLARKWRPRNFAEMVGQDHVVRALSNALNKDRLHHAYLFTGTRGVGKTTLARILSKSLNCEKGVSASPCGSCGTCREIDEGRFVDLLEVDAASKTGVDDTRELLDNVPYAPVRGRYKVYLIDEVHMFSGHSFNALLKTLEEPPPHVKFLLATTDPQKVPVTVLSRCLQFNLKRLPVEQIEQHLGHILSAEGIEFEPAALSVLARSADGSMRDGLSLLDQAIAYGAGSVGDGDVRAMLGVVADERLPQILAAVARGDAARVMDEIEALSEHAPDFTGVLGELVTYLHRVALLQQVPDAAQAAWGDAERLTELAATLSAEDVQLYYQIALNGRRDQPLAPDPRSGFEMTLLRMLVFRPDADDDVHEPTVQSSFERKATARKPAVGEPPPRSVSVPADREQDVREQSQSAYQSTVDAAGLSDWYACVAAMGLKGMAAQLAENCVFAAWDGKQLTLRLDPACAGLKGSLAEHRLQEAVAALIGHSVTLVFEFSEASEDQDTPAQRQEKARLALQQATEADFAADPVVRAAQETFDAEIVADSIRLIDAKQREG